MTVSGSSRSWNGSSGVLRSSSTLREIHWRVLCGIEASLGVEQGHIPSLMYYEREAVFVHLDGGQTLTLKEVPFGSEHDYQRGSSSCGVVSSRQSSRRISPRSRPV